MSRQANGVYLPPANTAAVSNQPIGSAAFNTLITDIGTEITNSVDRLGRSAMQAALPMGNNKITGLATPTVSTDAATKNYVDTAPVQDKAVTLQKLYHPTATSRLLGSDSNAALTITGAANNGSGLIRLTVGSTSTFATSQVKTVSDVVGTTEANGTWTITVVDATHIDLQGSTFTNGYASGGTIGGGVEEISLGSGLALTGSVLSASINPTLIPGYLSGLILATAGSTSTFSVATGSANDDSSGGMMVLASAINKNTASWAVGNNGGSLDTGAISINTWYHVFLIKRTDTGVVDILISINASSPAMPASYTLKRRIGSMKTDAGSNWTSFTQISDQFIWLNPVTDFNASPTAGARNSLTLSVPIGLVVTALFRATVTSVTVATEAIVFTALIEADSSAVNDLNVIVGSNAAGSFARITDNLSHIGLRALTSTATLLIGTYGWIDTRGK
jgi:hypothetical protein